MRRTLVVGTAVLAAALGGSAALADQSYTDPTGDSETAADLTGVDVVSDEYGNISFRIPWVGGQLLPKDDVVYLAIDTDRNALTGAERGEEVALKFDGDPTGPTFGTWQDGRWDGAKIDYGWVASSARVLFRPGEIDVLITTSDLNGTTAFDFRISSSRYSGDAIIAQDAAPDGSARYTYELAATPTVHLGTGRPLGTPVAPLAGKKFAIAVQVVRADAQPVTRATVRCSVHAGSRAVRAVGSFSGGSARCRMTVPTGTRGEMLRGAVSVATKDATARKPFAFKIR